MSRRTITSRTKIESVWIGLNFRDQVADVPIALGGRDHQHVWQASERSDTTQIAKRVVREAGIKRRVHDVPGGVNQQRIPIGWGLGHLIRCDRAARTGLVLDDDRMPERNRQSLGYGPSDDVSAASSGKRNHQFNRLGWPVGLRPRYNRNQSGCQAQQSHDCVSTNHHESPKICGLGGDSLRRRWIGHRQQDPHRARAPINQLPLFTGLKAGGVLWLQDRFGRHSVQLTD